MRSVFDVVLVTPEIAPNAGNVMRMCANTGSRLHLVAPLGFDLDDAKMRRAGLDYRDMTTVTVHSDWATAAAVFAGRRMFAFTAQARQWHTDAAFAALDVLVFGRESSGLPETVLGQLPADRLLRIPMVPGSRSLNLSNSAALAVYEAWRQIGFPGAV
jgi:tRNA (cytidine/uridine-2'-O-)-methyltransferase